MRAAMHHPVLGRIGFVLAWLTVFNTRAQEFSSSREQRCYHQDTSYGIGQRFEINRESKVFRCTCTVGARIRCTWSPTTSPSTKCYDRVTRIWKRPGSSWERIRNGRTLDCSCIRGSSGMQVTCSDENRCYHKGISHRAGTQFETTSDSGRHMNCECLQGKKLTCTFRETVPAPATNSPRREDYVLREPQVLHPQIWTLQACRTGEKVVTNGAVWNQTNTDAFGVKMLEECTCENAIVKCKRLRVVDRIEPHCTSLDGRLRLVGKRWIRRRERYPHQEYICECYAHEKSRCRRTRVPYCLDDVAGEVRTAGDQWKRVHETVENLVFQCTCNDDRRITCKDIGKCSEPPSPVNGAILCANIGIAGGDHVVYCKPMCLADYEFINPERYFRIWEACGPMNLHRWSGGFLGDPDAIARCKARRMGTRRGHSNLYLPTNNCSGMSNLEIEQQKDLFLRQLQFRHLCSRKCQITVFKCGAVE